MDRVTHLAKEIAIFENAVTSWISESTVSQEQERLRRYERELKMSDRIADLEEKVYNLERLSKLSGHGGDDKS